MRSALRPGRGLPRVLALCCLVLAAACGGADDDPIDDDPNAVIVVTPATATLTIVDGVDVEQPFTAVLRSPDGDERDVTDEVAWTITETHVGYFQDATLVARGAGRGTITASLDGRAGTAAVEVFVRDIRIGEGAPTNAPDLFDAAVDDPGRVATIVYPANATIVPPNLGDLDVHWRDDTGSDLFEIRLTTYYADVRVYIAGAAAAGAWLALLPEEWSTVARSEVGATIDISVRGLTQASPGSSSRAQIRLHTSREEIQGGIYYWAAANAGGSDGIFRHDMTRPGQEAEPFFTRAESGDRCVACHALSRDGTKMAITYDGGDGGANVLDVATRTTLMPTEQAWNFAAFTPDGNELLVARQGALSLRDPATGNVIATPVTSGWATHPDVAPTGDRIVYVRPASPAADWHFSGGALVTQTFDDATNTFGGEQPLVSSAENNYYPSFSPDGEWVLFNRSTEDAYDDGTAELWIVKVDGSVGPLELDAANLGPGLTNSWARWAPFEGTYGTQDYERVFWLTFSSKRDFGVRLVGANRPQIWMTPFFPGRAEAGQDPTAPAFRLPFQDLDSNNHIAQWTEAIIPVE